MIHVSNDKLKAAVAVLTSEQRTAIGAELIGAIGRDPMNAPAICITLAAIAGASRVEAAPGQSESDGATTHETLVLILREMRAQVKAEAQQEAEKKAGLGRLYAAMAARGPSRSSWNLYP